MTYPTPWTVQVEAWQSGATDTHGNPVDDWAAPVDVDVYGWSVPMSEEPRPLEQRVVVDVKLYAPHGTQVGSKDRVTIPAGPHAGVYTVEGGVEDYNHGPFGFQPGVVVNLQRVEG